MFTQAMMMFLYTESPLHVGSGRDMGVIDLPIQRDKVTQYPIVQASSLKGKLRAELPHFGTEITDDKINTLFGKAESGENNTWAGAISPSDARILLFPVRSLNGVFAWVTSLDVLMRFQRDAALAKLSLSWKLPEEKVATDCCWVAPQTVLKNSDTVTLEEFTFRAQNNNLVTDLAKWLADTALPQTSEYAFWRNKLAAHLVILPDDDFRDFTLYSTEVNTRVKLVPETKTVQNGALWTEENLPSDSLLYAPLAVGDSREYRDEKSDAPAFTATQVAEIMHQAFHQKRFQLGGDETVGRGYVMANIFKGNGGAK